MNSPTQKLAKAAIYHVLNALANDPRKFWLMGDLTGSYEKLTLAHAAICRVKVSKIRETFRPDKEKWERYVEEKEHDDKLLSDVKEKRDVTVHCTGPDYIDFDSWWLETGQYLEPVASTRDHDQIALYRQLAKAAFTERMLIE